MIRYSPESSGYRTFFVELRGNAGYDVARSVRSLQWSARAPDGLGARDGRSRSLPDTRAQAELDLPDPLAELDSATAVDADALLQQLAGDEVDRLVEQASTTTVADAEQAANSVQNSLDALFNELTASDAPSPAPASSSPAFHPHAPAAPSAGTGDDVVASQLDALFEELQRGDTAADAAFADAPITQPAVLPGESTTAASTESATVADADDDLESALEAATTSATAASPALDSSADVAAELHDAIAHHETQTAAGESTRPSWLLKLLLWINRPMLRLTDPAREAIGTIAIVTTLNALAVLMYVLLFKK